MKYWKEALQSLTPGGSEFQSPGACRDYVRERLHSGQDAKKELVRLRRVVQDLVEALEPLANTIIGPETANRIETTIIETTGNGELASHVRELLISGPINADRALAKARGEGE